MCGRRWRRRTATTTRRAVGGSRREYQYRQQQYQQQQSRQQLCRHYGQTVLLTNSCCCLEPSVRRQVPKLVTWTSRDRQNGRRASESMARRTLQRCLHAKSCCRRCMSPAGVPVLSGSWSEQPWLFARHRSSPPVTYITLSPALEQPQQQSARSTLMLAESMRIQSTPSLDAFPRPDNCP